MSTSASPVIEQESGAMSASRAAFEVHFKRTRGVLELERAGAGYRNGLAQDAWMDWQAGAASVAVAAVAAAASEERVPGIGYPTTYADLARLSPVQLWNRWYPDGRSVDAREAFIAARTIPFVASVVPASPAGSREARDAALLRWLMANPTWGMRWRMKSGKEQWQMVNDGESSGKWGDFREVLQAAAATHPARQGEAVPVAAPVIEPRQFTKTEAQHRADFELALKGNNLKRYDQVSHAAYMDGMIENMWRGWMRKAKFDGTTQY